jgi:hypothetical protein
MTLEQIKPLAEKSLNTFCAIFDFCKGEPDITTPVSDSPTACLRALERRGLIRWDTERVKGKTKRWAALTETGAKYGCEGLALVPSVTSPARNRQWVKVQFDLRDDDYLAAWDVAGELALQRQLAPTIRDLLLIHDLAEKGDYRLFYELYGLPNSRETEQFATMIQTFAKMQRTIDTLTAKLDSLQNTRIPANIGANSSEPPVHREKVHDDGKDDVEMEVTQVVTTGNEHLHEFLKSVFSLQEPKAEPAPVGLRAGNVASVPMPDLDDDIEIEW